MDGDGVHRMQASDLKYQREQQDSLQRHILETQWILMEYETNLWQFLAV
jgi:hypothetical protein